MWLRSSPPRCTPARSPTAGRRRSIAVAPSCRHLSDSDERLADAPGEQPLQPEQRHQRLVAAQRSGGNQPAAQHATRHPPPGDAGEVEVFEMAEVKARRPELVRQLGGGVTAGRPPPLLPGPPHGARRPDPPGGPPPPPPQGRRRPPPRAGAPRG